MLATLKQTKEKLQHRRFPMNFVKFLRHLFLKNTSSDCFCRFISYLKIYHCQANKIKFIEIFLLHQLTEFGQRLKLRGKMMQILDLL